MDVPGYYFSTGGTFGSTVVASAPEWKTSVEPCPQGSKSLVRKPIYHSREAGIEVERARCLSILRGILSTMQKCGNTDPWLEQAIAEIEKR